MAFFLPNDIKTDAKMHHWPSRTDLNLTENVHLLYFLGSKSLYLYIGTFDDADGYRGFADAVASRQRVAAEVALVDTPDVQRCLQVVGKVLQNKTALLEWCKKSTDRNLVWSLLEGGKVLCILQEGRSLKSWCFIPLAARTIAKLVISLTPSTKLVSSSKF